MFNLSLHEANPELGYNFPFILLSPQKITGKVKVFMEGNNSVYYSIRNEKTFEMQKNYALKVAENMCIPRDGSYFDMGYLYQRLNQPLIIPIIERVDSENDEFYTQMLGRNVMLDKTSKFANLNKQLVQMVNVVQQMFRNKGILVDENAGLLGSSTSGVLAARLQFIEPETFDTCISLLSNSAQPLPLKELNGNKLIYPLGTADYEEFFGKPFNEAAYRNAKQLFVVGKQESNEKYNIVKNPTLHSKNIQNLWLSTFGDITLQERQKQMSEIFNQNNFNNITCVVAEGEHSLEGKGNIISSWVRENIHKQENSKEL